MRCVIGAVALLTLVGCRTSDKTMDVPEGVLKVGKPEQVRPVGNLPIAFSADGGRMITMLPEGDEFRSEIRDVSTHDIVTSLHLPKDAYPIMFGMDKESVFCVTKEGVGLFSSNTQIEVGAIKGASPIARNHDHTITVFESDFGCLAVTASGAKAESRSRPLFDQYGNVWIKGGDWTKMTKAGSVDHFNSPPKYLVNDQQRLRGSLSLHVESETITRQGADAEVGIVWLEHGYGKNAKAAMVYTGSDVFEVGFVPNKPMIWIITYDGGYLIPYAIERATE